MSARRTPPQAQYDPEANGRAIKATSAGDNVAGPKPVALVVDVPSTAPPTRSRRRVGPEESAAILAEYNPTMADAVGRRRAPVDWPFCECGSSNCPDKGAA
ncbi:hypothetical protein ACFZB9_16500 [Kitasatospora sp. NPDC008050]|uniref:hypothetical protein n=1 Tax=Kitasatospora sp. NPDC008050 TaxID=3364021 RepID=UPI0036E8DEC8